MLSKFIKQLRLKNNFNQSFVAEHISVSRPTYLEIEKGTRDLTITEAQKLADLFGLSLDSLLNQNEIVTVVDDQKTVIKKHDDIRISIPQNNLEKFKQVLLYILTKVGSKPNIGETAIYKLLYFIDFDYYEKYEEQLMGLTYIKNYHGPTPKEFIKVVEEMKEKGEIEEVKSPYFKYEQRKYLPYISSDLSQLNGRELEMIDSVLSRLSDKSATELSEYSHRDVPWMTHEEGEAINYESVFYRNDPYSVRQYKDEI